MARKKTGTKVVNTSGKRKTAIARATLKPGKGRVRVNGSPIHIMEPELARRKALEPLLIAEAMNRTDRCLLYTSPSPRDATLSRMPSSA